MVIIPANCPSSCTTANRRTPWVRNSGNASRSSASQGIVITGEVITASIRLSGDTPAARALRTRSRSVTIPISRVPSITANEPTPLRSMTTAASWIVRWGPIPIPDRRTPSIVRIILPLPVLVSLLGSVRRSCVKFADCVRAEGPLSGCFPNRDCGLDESVSARSQAPQFEHLAKSFLDADGQL
jgi:hypothetical protein